MRALFHLLTRNVVSLAGTTITTASALVFAPKLAIAHSSNAPPAPRSFTRRDASHLSN